jgi:polyhydroxyalkanoate synthase
MSDVVSPDNRERARRYLSLWQRNLQAWAAEPGMAPATLPAPLGEATVLPAAAEPVHAARPGPRPLPAHLALMSMATVAGVSALPLMTAGSPLWHPSVAGEDGMVAALEPPLIEVMGALALDQLREALAGVAAYRAHPYRRALADPPAVWSEGTTRLLDYGALAEKAGGLPILVIPSLVNPAYILDLREGASLLRHLADAGFRPFLVDWGAPGPEERGFDLDCYIIHRLEPVLERVRELAGDPVVMGYCMGGTLAMALASRRAGAIRAFVALATPWDFSVDCPPPFRMAAMAGGGLAALGLEAVAVPLDMLQLLFASLDPVLGLAKFRRFAAMDPASPAALAFVALEDWANDGMALAGPAAAQVAADWYRDNRPPGGTWMIGDEAVRPAGLSCPALVAVPGRDRLVPPGSARPLAEQIAGATVLQPKAGHVGMIVGSRAREALYDPLTAWLRALA